ncbi:MAG: amidase [Betaproteobacteria bacterium]
MRRRDFMRAGLIGSGAITGGFTMAAPTSTTTSDLSVVEASIDALQHALQAGTLTSRALVRVYLARIRTIDKAGPRINAVIEINPDALTIAGELDRERKAKGPRGTLHGIPVLIKDNIATADGMQTTAGSLALIGVKPPRDASIVTRLREAGAIILGKTNLSEWANMRSIRSTSGWSGRGGLTRNPYALDRNTSGSSSGSAAAVAASLAAVAVGTETDGSIISPANMNGLVGIKPTVGLVSRHGIIPIAHSQDTAGPMARSVADAAALLTVLAGADSQDDATREANEKLADYSKALDRDGLKGARIGVVRANFGGRNELVSAVIEDALKVLQAQGATLIDVELPNADKYRQTELEVLLYELKADMAKYLAEFAPNANVRTLKDLISFNEREKLREMPYFGQELFTRSEAKGGLDSKEYLDALANNHRYSRTEGIDQVLQAHQLDALVAPSGGLPWLTDFYKGDYGGGGFTSPAAVAGYPHITVPAGFVHGLPAGISFVGTAWSESKLIRLAYAYEQASRQRRAPTFAKSANPPV